MNLATFLLAHLQASITRVPYDAEELATAYRQATGLATSTALVEAVMAELVRQGRARVEGDGWCYVVPKAKEERSLF